MPLLGTRGAASAQAFGMFSTTAGPYWIGVLAGSSSEDGFGIAVDNSGNVYLGNRSYSSPAGFSIVKYNRSGTIQWQRSLGGTLNDGCYGIAVDSSSNVYVVGYSYYSVQEIALAKYDTSGTIQWQRRLGAATGTHIGRNIAVDSSGNVYVVGESFYSPDNVFEIAKYDTSGTIQWQRRLGNPGGSDYGYGIAVDSSGNVYVSGNLSTYNWGVAKYNTSGTIQWQRSLGGYGVTTSSGAAVDSSGNVYVVGTSQGGNIEILLAKYNTSGTIQWQKTLGSPGYDRGYGIAVDSSGNVYINGSSDAGSTGVETFQLAKYNTSGTIQWQRMLGRTSRPCIGYAVATDSSGNVYVNGSMNNSGLTDIFFGKFPGNGSLTGGYNVGSYTNVYYVASSCTDAASTLTDAASSGTDAASTLTDAASSLTDAASTLTSTIKQI